MTASRLLASAAIALLFAADGPADLDPLLTDEDAAND